VHKLMRGTIADPLTAPEAARMAESIRAVFNANAKALKLLPTSRARASRSATGSRRAMKRTNAKDGLDPVHLGALRRHERLFAAAHAVARYCDEHADDDAPHPDLKSGSSSTNWARLHRLPALEKGLQTARNFGGAIVTGIHAYAKLKEVYGENMAMTLSSLAGPS
jgi:hypothetical protein